jgi:hypothetical protein
MPAAASKSSGHKIGAKTWFAAREMRPSDVSARRTAGLPLAALVAALSHACARPAVHTVPVEIIDTLDYVLGDSSLWPRVGTQLQHQIVDRARQEVCWVKYGDAEKFECWRWNDRWIYHEVDHALDGDSTGRSYSFSDGRWLPRHLSGTWTLDLPRNREIDFTPDCRATERPFPYRLRAHLEPAHDLGGDLGTRPTLVLEYEPYAPGARPNADALERFLFAEGAGWYAWESARGTARFDRVGGPAPTRTGRCRDHPS